MAENEKQKNGEASKETASYSFVNEKIKSRPISKSRMFRKTMQTVLAAIIFGAVACVTFLLLEPVINNRISPEEEVEPVVLPEIEETSPEELLTDETVAENYAQEQEQQITEQITEQIDKQIAEGTGDSDLGLKSYLSAYDKLYETAQGAAEHMVTVTGVSTETDWFQNEVENINETSGVIIAKNESGLYILADLNGLPDADSYRAKLPNGSRKAMDLKGADPNTGLAVFLISSSVMSNEEKEMYEPLGLSNSNANAIVGHPIIAVGSPLGQTGGVCYGIVTSNQLSLSYADYGYKVITTDITGSQNNASGIIINTSGKLLGIITKESSTGASGALLAGFGITDIKALIENLSNEQQRIYLGIHGAEVTEAIHTDLGIPYGIYVGEVDSGSPAMTGGVAKADVITKIGNRDILEESDYEAALKDMQVTDTVSMNLLRYNGTEYIEIETELIPQILE
ncbi:MAG: S1C family serine protease [Lachnospiraceae bacterium]|nr:S1C family serine protease [Lachnospiraceae bacterium]